MNEEQHLYESEVSERKRARIEARRPFAQASISLVNRTLEVTLAFKISRLDFPNCLLSIW